MQNGFKLPILQMGKLTPERLNYRFAFEKNIFAVPGIESRASYMLDKCSITKLHPQAHIWILNPIKKHSYLYM